MKTLNAVAGPRHGCLAEPAFLGTVPTGNDRVVADCGDVFKQWSPALRAGYCHCGGLGGDGDGGCGDGGGGGTSRAPAADPAGLNLSLIHI